MLAGDRPYIETVLQRRMVSRMQRTHDRRRVSFFVGPPGIGKSTAIEAFRVANSGNVLVSCVLKRGVTGPQVLQQLLGLLRARCGEDPNAITRSGSETSRQIFIRLEKICDGRRRDQDEGLFPHLTIVFDEAQRLTNAAIDALRDYAEPHYFCRGPFTVGMIFVGNNELSLKVERGGMGILDEGMADRLLYRDRYEYEDVERADLEQFIRCLGVEDKDALSAVVTVFAAQRQVRSFRRIADFVDELRDEAGGQPITRATVQGVLNPA